MPNGFVSALAIGEADIAAANVKPAAADSDFFIVFFIKLISRCLYATFFSVAECTLLSHSKTSLCVVSSDVFLKVN
jgi:hypothetical protein